MSTFVSVNTYTHSVTFVTDKILFSLQRIIRLSGLNPSKISADWKVLERGIKTWLKTEHLEELVLEVFNPKTDKLLGRWDFEIFYGYEGDGNFWIDTDLIKYHIKKTGLYPEDCDYRIVVKTKKGRPEVDGWSNTSFRSTEGLSRHSIGTGINGSGLNSNIKYWN